MRNLTFWISAILVIVFLWAIALTVKKNRENEYNMEQTRKAIKHQKQEWAKEGLDYDEVKGMTQKELEKYRMRLFLDSLFDKMP
jgi:uncharacterized membrane protein